ncbi:cold-shock protein [Chitinophaga sp.]|uniref:cold-shock protein n=2 Tax=Chitinophaga TaxID=79328 RepID=UPI002FDD61A6
MGETFSKKEKNNKKAKAKLDKAEKMRFRKTNNDKGKSLEDMLAYVDENGNLTPFAPKGGTESVPLHELAAMAKVRSRPPEDTTRTGFVSFYNSTKGFGFITEDNSKDSIFFHNNQLSQPVKEKDKVTFTKERSPRGYNAANVKLID